MSINPLLAISPIDGRYFSLSQSLSPLFSEFGLIHHRLSVEIHWLIHLSEVAEFTVLPPFTAQQRERLHKIYQNFSLDDAEVIKDIERITNHDLKAIEYWLKQKLQSSSEFQHVTPFIHFGCTSEDINNLAYALIMQKAYKTELVPAVQNVLERLVTLARYYGDTAMLARTHGQPATPTTFGKEFANFAWRLQNQLDLLNQLKIYAKFNGATGNYNAWTIAFPELNWPQICEDFVKQFNLSFNPLTTQIEPHDFLSAHCQAWARINTILIGLTRDIWAYTTMDYLTIDSKVNEVGSSTMPHKVNPIDFENSEGNLLVANQLLSLFSERLPVSRLQRDLVDSTLQRNLGVAFSHSLVAHRRLSEGIAKLVANKANITRDLDRHWEVLTEAIQTILRRHGIEDAYEIMKEFSRGQKIDAHQLHELIKQLPIPSLTAEKLLQLTPQDYVGLAPRLVEYLHQQVTAASKK